ncbi:unnamed protein product [Dicrocoelium dendriticum]|nr:unnamed protein product [Dicrocoelium dendriticum]
MVVGKSNGTPFFHLIVNRRCYEFLEIMLTRPQLVPVYQPNHSYFCPNRSLMKLFSHNILTSRVLKSVKVGYPLALKVKNLQVNTVDFDAAYISKLIPKVEWGVLKKVSDQIGQEHIPPLPDEVPADYETNECFLKLAHRALLEVDILEGALVCPETGREFPISDGIPNMLVNEGE